MPSTHADCSSCGTCCRKGGPVLHLQDSALVGQALPYTMLITLRAGELTYDPVTSRLVPLETEVIKVAGVALAGHSLADAADSGGPATAQASAAGGSSPWTCAFLEGEAHCRIYDHRPAQCRALFCKDTKALEALYAEGRLTRKDILATAPAGWLDLAMAHEQDCSLAALIPLARQALTDPQADASLLEALRFDAAFRELCVEKAAMPAAVLNCVLGRPLADFLASFGLGVVGSGEGQRLERMGLRVYP